VIDIYFTPTNIPQEHQKLQYFYTTVGQKLKPYKIILSKSINEDWILIHPWISDTPANVPVEIQQISKAEYTKLSDIFDEIETLNILGISNLKQIDEEIKRLESKLNIPKFIMRPFQYAEIIKILNRRIDRLTTLKSYFKSNQQMRVIFN